MHLTWLIQGVYCMKVEWLEGLIVRWACVPNLWHFGNCLFIQCPPACLPTRLPVILIILSSWLDIVWIRFWLWAKCEGIDINKSYLCSVCVRISILVCVRPLFIYKAVHSLKHSDAIIFPNLGLSSQWHWGLCWSMATYSTYSQQTLSRGHSTIHHLVEALSSRTGYSL